jgi:hypothetical protein
MRRPLVLISASAEKRYEHTVFEMTHIVLQHLGILLL